jgi:dienelactone hydrolase
MIDLFDGEPFPLEKINLVIAHDSAFTDWLKTKTSPAAWEKVHARLVKYCEYLRSDLGFDKVGVIGFCYGGSSSVLVSSSGKFDAAVSIHGAGHSTDDLAKAKCPIFYIVADGDPSFPKEKVEGVQAALKEHPEQGKIKVFEGVQHGWVNRGQYDDPEVQKKADEAMADTVAFLSTHLRGGASCCSKD